MTRRVRIRGLIAFGVLLGASQLFGTVIPPAALPCATSTLDNYVSLGEVGCSLGGVFDANGFEFTGAPLAASDITVTPTVTSLGGNIVLIDFNISGNFTNTTSGPITYTFDYILDPLRPPVINGSSIGLDPSGVLTENLCAGGVFTGSACPETAFFAPLVANADLMSPILTASTGFPMAVSIVDYHIVLELQPGDSAGGFDSKSITGLGAGSSTVPEPGAGSLATAGLLGLLAFRSRAKLRQVALQLFTRV
jgi:hypothetical protein